MTRPPTTINATFRRFVVEDEGATAIEYGLLSGLIAVGLIASFVALGNGLGALFDTTGDSAGGAISDAAGQL